MGQYWIPVNITKKQYIDPHKIGPGDGWCGLKLIEQLWNKGSKEALFVLLADMPERRGGGDIKEDPIIGSWAGDQIVIAGDYAAEGEIAEGLYNLTGTDEFTDITQDVRKVLAANLEWEE